MGLLPLEFTDCLQDSPYFRDSLHSHEKELERTSQNIKELIKEVKNLLQAAKNLSRAQRSLSSHLINFKFDCIGSQQTDDELVIAGSLKEFGKLISAIEDERDRMLERAHDSFILPLETFRKEHIGAVKERKKKFEKQTAKFCSSQERYLGLSTRKQDTVLQEADATLEMEQRDFARAALEYVYLIQEVQERKKFEFVETLQAFMYGWLTFYHQGHEVAKDFKPYMTDLQVRVQNTRENFNSSRDDIQALMRKMLEVRQTKPVDPGALNKMYTRTGYLFFMEKKALGTTWQKCYCQYISENRLFCMIPYNQTAGKITNTESFRIRACIKRSQESIDKRFCFDIVHEDRNSTVYTFQAQSEEDRSLWIEALDGRESLYAQPPGGRPSTAGQTFLDEAGFNFVSECCRTLEKRGLEEQGLYRVVGVASKVTKLLTMGLDRRKFDKLNLDDSIEWESKTISSAIKTYLRNLPEPLMSFALHARFIDAAKYETYSSRLGEVHRLVHLLPPANQKMLGILLAHLNRVVQKCDKNLMTVSNLGVCFGPTLLRAEEETVAAIMDIKFANVVVEILIQNGDLILNTKPGSGGPPKPAHHLHSTPSSPSGAPLAAVPSSSSSPGSPLSPAAVPSSPPAAVSPLARPPPPYCPPPCVGTAAATTTTSPPSSQHQSSPPIPTLATAVIFEGPKLHPQPQASLLGSPPPLTNGPTSAAAYATWERTLKGGGGIAQSQPPMAATTLVTAPPLGSAPPHHHYRSSSSLSANNSSSSLLAATAAANNSSQHNTSSSSSSVLSNHSASSSSPQAGTAGSQQQLHYHQLQQQQATSPWYRPNQAPARVQLQQHRPVSSSGGGLVPAHSRLLSQQPPSSAGAATSNLLRASSVSASGHLSGYETSTTNRSSSNSSNNSSNSSSTESLASWSSRDTGGVVAGGGGGGLGGLEEMLSQPTPPHTHHRLHPPLAQGRGVAGLQAVELRKVRTLYACVGEHETELSFEPNQIITSVRPSLEPGWLEGHLDGKVGLVPENYVEYI